MFKNTILFFFAVLSQGNAFGAETQVRCVLSGPTLNWDYVTLLTADFAADPDKIPPEVPKPGALGCSVRSLSSPTLRDEKRFSSLRIDLLTCHGTPAQIQSVATFGDHSLSLMASLSDILNDGRPTSIYALKDDEVISTPSGALMSIWLQCFQKPVDKKPADQKAATQKGDSK